MAIYYLQIMEIHHSIVDWCSPQNTLIVLGDFNAINDTERDGYKLCVGPLGSGTRNVNHSLLNCAKSRKLRITNSWLQRHKPCCWTWYSNAGSVVKEIEHIHVNTRRILQRVIWSAEFFVTDQTCSKTQDTTHQVQENLKMQSPRVLTWETREQGMGSGM